MDKTQETQNQEDSTTVFENVQTKRQKEFIQLQDHCTLCNTALDVQHLADFESWSVREEAYCSCCDVRTRNRLHSLN